MTFGTAEELMEGLFACRLVKPAWHEQAPHLKGSWGTLPPDVLLDHLVQARLLTPLQRDYVQSGRQDELVCGSYRLLAREESMPDTFHAEHMWLGHGVLLRRVPADGSFSEALKREQLTQPADWLDAGRCGDGFFFVTARRTSANSKTGQAEAEERERTPTVFIPPQPERPTTPAPVEEHERRVLIVDDEASIRDYCRLVLQASGINCDEAADGAIALKAFQRRLFDLVLLDVDMPHMNGLDTCRALRQLPSRPHLKIILFSGRSHPDDLAQMLLSGADDYLTKPFSPLQLQSRIQAALRLQLAQERSDRLNLDLLVLNRELEKHLQNRASDLVDARNGLVLALAKLVEYRDNETGAHLQRLQVFCRRLGEAALANPSFASQLDIHFIDMLACCAPLHDIGKVGLPDHILLKPDKLLPDERRLMETHTVIGADTLNKVAEQHGFALAFLQMAIDITRHHHERFDGKGYPDRLAGTAIPLAARIVSVCDVYDALRSRRIYKPSFPHAQVAAMIQEGAGTQFDPMLVQCFLSCAADFERIYAELAD